MASRSTAHQAQASPSRSAFFQQRDALVGEIAISLEHVLQNINKLNRSLEGVIAVGNEFGAVEALWSQFEGVMAQEPEDGKEGEGKEENQDDDDDDDDEGVRDGEGEEENDRERPQSKGRGR